MSVTKWSALGWVSISSACVVCGAVGNTASVAGYCTGLVAGHLICATLNTLMSVYLRK